ncbi:MAG: hypothetical protein QW552_07455 [Ignisphaera sp.]
MYVNNIYNINFFSTTITKIEKITILITNVVTTTMNAIETFAGIIFIVMLVLGILIMFHTLKLLK